MQEFINFFIQLPVVSVWVIQSLGGTILGLLVYAGTTYFIAARKFQETIRNEFIGLYPTPANWPDDGVHIKYILEEKFSRIEKAASSFRENLPFFLLNGFDAAWVKYYNENGNKNRQDYSGPRK